MNGLMHNVVADLYGPYFLLFYGAVIVAYCHHGVRSRQVANWLRGQGFTQVQSLAGGIDRWTLEIDATLPRY